MMDWNAMSPRERDALVAEKVMGLDVRGEGFAINVEGEWSVRGDGDSDGWMCYAGTEPVYVRDGGPRCVDPPTLDNELELMEYGASREDCERYYEKKLDEWKRDHERWGCHHYDLEVVPRYTEDIAAAWEVVEKMERELWNWTSDRRIDTGLVAWRWHSGPRIHRADEPTAPEAICLAALRAMGVEV